MRIHTPKEIQESATHLLIDTLAESGEAFFKATLQLLAQLLDINYIIIAVPTGAPLTTMQVIAGYSSGQWLENLSYPLAGMPCGEAMAQGMLTIGREMQQQFPRAVYPGAPQAESYMGFSLLTPSGEVAGVLAMIHHEQMPHTDEHLSFIIGTLLRRAGAELEQHLAMHKLRHSDNKLRCLLDSGMIGVVEWDLKGSMRYANDYMLQITGYSQQDVEEGSMKWSEMTPPEYTPLDMNAIQEMQQHGICTLFEKEYFRKDGSRVPVWARAAWLNEDQQLGIGIILDISERKQAENVAKANEIKFKGLAESGIAGVATASFEGDGTVAYANDYMLNLLGYSRDDLQEGRLNWRNITPHEYIDRDRVAIEETTCRGACTPYEKEFIRKDGSRANAWIAAAMLNQATAEAIVCVIDITAHKAAEEKIRQSEELYRSIAENFPNGHICVFDREYNTLFIEGQELARLGVSPADFTGKKLSEYSHPAHLNTLLHYYDRAFTGETISFEHTWAGSHYSVNASPLRSKNGDIERIVVVIQNVDSLKAAEEKIRQSERLYRTIARNYPNGVVYLIDEDLKVIFMEGSDLQKGDVMPEQMVGRPITDFFLAHDNKALARKKYIEAFIEKKVVSYEFESVMLGGTYMVTAAPLLDEKGQVEYLLVVNQNITQLRKIEQRLLDNKARLQEAQRIARLGNWEFDLRTRHLDWSEENYRLHGLHPSQKLPPYEELCRFYHPEDHALLREKFIEAVTKGVPYDIDVRVLLPDDKFRHINMIARPIINENGQCIKLYGISMDITERKEVAEALRTAKEKAEEAYLLRTNFLANMTHEIRTPLNGILGLAQIISEECKEEMTTEYARLIEESGRRLLTTINSILDFSKLEAGKVELQLKPQRVFDVCEKIVRSLKVLADMKHLRLFIECHDRQVKALMDEMYLGQVLVNLIGNAIKFTEKGSITVAIDRVEKEAEQLVSIKVIDTGIGIPPEYLSKLFTPFTQASTGYGRRFDGTGLGLSICKGVLELMNAGIQAESVEGEGSTFEVWLKAGE